MPIDAVAATVSSLLSPVALQVSVDIMAPSASPAPAVVQCRYCIRTFAHEPHLARHVQVSHPNEDHMASASAAAVSLIFGTFGVGGEQAPALLDPVPAPVTLAAAPLPGVATTGAMELDNASALGADAAVEEESDQVPPHHGDVGDRYGDIYQWGSDDGHHQPEDDTGGNGDSPVALLSDTDEDEGGDGTACQGTDEGDESVGGFVGDAAEYRVFDDWAGLFGVEEDATGVQRRAVVMPRHVMYSSTAARIRAYYERMPEASQSVPVVDPFWAGRPSRFTSPALRGALRFAFTAGGSGLSDGDQVAFAATLRAVEREAVRGTAARGPMTSAFVTDHGFLSATRHEINRVLAERDWQEVAITVGDRQFVYYYRDLLKVGLDTLASASDVSFGPNDDAADRAATGGMNEDSTDLPAVVDLDSDDTHRVRRGSLDSDMYLLEVRSAQRLHGAAARVMGVQLHADEALVSWSGATYMFPIRAKIINAIAGGGRWVTIGYVQHVPKPTERTKAAKLANSDIRNDLFPRCLAVTIRTFVRASETGVTAPVAGRGMVLLVPRVLGIVVDQVEERSILGLMGNQCNYFCSPCMEDKRVGGALMRVRAVNRDVISTLDAQLEAAVIRAEDPRPSRRRLLGEQHSALPFVPVLGAVHGLGTRGTSLYRIVSFDVLHVWKLGVLRLLAQRLPAVLNSLCVGRAGARFGSVAETLDVLNLRFWELGRNCKATPASPGYVTALL